MGQCLPSGRSRKGWYTDYGYGKQECPNDSPEAFVFPNSRKSNGVKRNAFIRSDNYRAGVLKRLAEELGSRS